MTKKCTACGVLKKRSEFHVRRKSPDGLCSICKACNCAKSSVRFAMLTRAERDQRNAQERKRYWKDVDKSRAHNAAKQKRLWRANPELSRGKNRLKMRKRYALNPEYFAKYSRRWQKANMKKHAVKNKAWRARNPDKWDEIKARASLSRGTAIAPQQWPDSLVRVKQQDLIMRRKICSLLKT